jgi:hypothetical protein
VSPDPVFDGRAFDLSEGFSRPLFDISTFPSVSTIQQVSWTTTSDSVFLLGRCVLESEKFGSLRGGSLVTVADDVYFVSSLGHSEGFEGDFRWEDDDEVWERLPVFEVGARSHRFGLDLGGVLTVFTSPMDNGRGESLRAHRFDPTMDEFVEWTIPDVLACRTAGAFDVVYFFSNFDAGTAPGLA